MPDPLQRLIGLISAVLTAPLLLALGLAIRLDTPGPVLYRAGRVGRDGKPYTCLKLRTMRTTGSASAAATPAATPDATPVATPSGPRVTRRRDPRVTRTGRLLRGLRLDELPQLWNVARGEMRLVGPRPEDPRFVDLNDPLHREVFTSVPGITGLAQLVFADEGALLDTARDPDAVYMSDIQPPKLRVDAAYLRHRSTRLDLWIIAQTPRAVLGRRIVLPLEIAQEIERLGGLGPLATATVETADPPEPVHA